jgi:flagellar FliL protein
MAIIDDTAPVKSGPSALLQVALLAGLTVAAIGIGWGAGIYLSRQQNPAPEAGTAENARATETSLSEAQGAMGVVYLDPITTNMGGASDTWIRIELALVFNGEVDLPLAQIVQQDVLAYLRTVKIHQVEGASGFQHLRTDLAERATLRSDGKVTDILIRTLLFE